MSMGYLVCEKAPEAGRGLIVMKAMDQMPNEVEWDALDIWVFCMFSRFHFAGEYKKYVLTAFPL